MKIVNNFQTKKIKNFLAQENQRFSGPENSENKYGVFLAFKLQKHGAEKGVRI